MDKFKFDEKEVFDIITAADELNENPRFTRDDFISRIETLISSRADSVLSSLPAPTQDGTAEEKNKIISLLWEAHIGQEENAAIPWNDAVRICTTYAAPIRAEIEEKNKRISEQAEKLRFSHDRIGELKSELAASQQRVAELEEAIKWALGENGEFVGREVGQGAFWWRTELRRRSKF